MRCHLHYSKYFAAILLVFITTLKFTNIMSIPQSELLVYVDYIQQSLPFRAGNSDGNWSMHDGAVQAIATTSTPAVTSTAITSSNPTAKPSTSTIPSTRTPTGTTTSPSNAPRTSTPTISTKLYATSMPTSAPTTTYTNSELADTNSTNKTANHANIHDSLPPCSWSQLNRIIPEGRWRMKTPQEKSTAFNPLCKFLKARYHCNENYTTAGDYIFEHDKDALAQEKCHVPTEQSAFETLAVTNKALLICGDSHAFEMYHRLLCQFEVRVDLVDMANGHIAKAMYARDGELPTCHGSQHVVDMFYGYDNANATAATNTNITTTTTAAAATSESSDHATIQTIKPRPCIYKIPGMSCARFKMPRQEGSDGLVVCAYYGRPDPGDVVAKKCHKFAMEGVPFPYNSDARSSFGEGNSKVTPRLFNVVYANQYLKLDLLMSEFNQTKSNKFNGTIVLVSKYQGGVQSVLGLTDVNAALENRKTNGKYSFGTGASDALQESWKTSLSTLAKESGVSAELLNVAPILESRSKDAKATMYPISGIRKGSSDNKYEVCCESMAALHQKKCSCETDFEITRSCQNRGLLGEPSTCGQDSHYCLPGPLSDVSRIIFSGMLTAAAAAP